MSETSHKTPTSRKKDGVAARADRAIRVGCVVFLLLSVPRRQWETETKSSWWATPKYDAASAKYNAHFPPSAAGNNGVSGLSPIKSVHYTSNNSIPHTRCETDWWRCLSQCRWQRWLWMRRAITHEEISGSATGNLVRADIFTQCGWASTAGKLLWRAPAALDRVSCAFSCSHGV